MLGRYFVGIDWGNKAHQVCVIDPQGVQLQQRSFAHASVGLHELVQWLIQVSGEHPEEVRIAIEIPRGSVVEALLERGFMVFALNPKQLDRFRDRHTVAGAKDDRRDAYVLADSIRTDERCFQQLSIDPPNTIRLRQLTRIEEDVVHDLCQNSNKLRELLLRIFPDLLALCPGADEAWLWDLLESIPTPQAVNHSTPKRVASILRKNRIRRITKEQLVAVLRSASVPGAPGVVEACAEHIAMLLPVLRLRHQQRLDLARRMDAFLDRMETDEEKTEHRDVRILRSLPGVGRIISATMLAEASQSLAARDYYAIRAHAGVAPVTKASGKRSGPRALVSQRHACSHRLRQALYHWARCSMQSDTASRDYYSRARARGLSHGRALRGLGDRLLRIFVAMLKSQSLFEPGRPARVWPGPVQPVTP